VSAELLEEKKRSLELYRELAAEKQQNKRVRTGVVELDMTTVNLGSSSTLQSASSLPLSRKFTQIQTTQVQTTQVQIQPTSTSSTRKEAAMHTLQFGRPPTAAYPTSIIATQRFNRTEQQVDLSVVVGHWKQALQKQGLYVPEFPPRRDSHESNIKRLRAAMKDHTHAWTKWSRRDEGIHHDRHVTYERMQNIYRIPSVYQDPNEWLENHLARPDHCQHFRCVSIWWYYDQLVRDTPGFVHNFKPPGDHPSRPSNQFNRSTDSTWTPIQINLSEEAAAQRPLLINRTMPEPHENLWDTEEWDTFYDDKMPEDQKRIMKDLLFEVLRIKGGNASTNKHYRDTRARIIEAAAAAYEKDRNSPQIPDYLIPVKTPWSSGEGHARLAYDQHIIEQHLNRVEQMRATNATLCQMEISSQPKHGPAGQGGF
jgi:hypothetical protein